LRFDELNIIAPILKAVKEEGYEIPTPIQEQTIPILLGKRDLIGCAQTGTGKTAAFAIPILQLLSEYKPAAVHKKAIRALILTPTRELAVQICESFEAYGRHLPLKTTVVFGGVSQVAQTNTLKAGVDILVATPGRLLDLIGQKYIELHHVEIFVLDEADRMLDMGFAPDVRRVIGMLPEIRQNMLFSATMPPEIIRLADKLLTSPANVSVTPDSSIVEIIEQSLYFVGKKDKRPLLIELLKSPDLASVLVFSRTKHGADRITKDLAKAGVQVAAIHGDKSQNNRQAALNLFKAKKIRVLVATDIAARGIDIDELTHVVNYDLPNVPETYIHRIGRTGRAGLGGAAISFCDEAEKACLKDIQKLIGRQVPIVHDHPWPLDKYVDTDPPEPADGANRGRNARNASVPRDSRGQRMPRDRSESVDTRNQRTEGGLSSPSEVRGSGRARRTSPPWEVRSQIDAREAASESRQFRGQDLQAAATSMSDTQPGTGRQNGKSAVSPSDAGLDGSPRLAGDRKSGPAPEEFERMARLLDGGRRRPAGSTGTGHGAGSGHGSTASPRQSPQASRRPSRQDPPPQAAARRNPSSLTSSINVRNDPQDISDHVPEPRREVSDANYQGRAAEQPGPFDSSSFLSKPLKQRPRGV
jgi:ATP-dependent RNA helicase RhlE